MRSTKLLVNPMGNCGAGVASGLAFNELVRWCMLSWEGRSPLREAGEANAEEAVSSSSS